MLEMWNFEYCSLYMAWRNNDQTDVGLDVGIDWTLSANNL
jgi:hypothetical protein